MILFAAIAFVVGASQNHPSDTPGERAEQFVSEVVANELRAQETDHSLWRYRQIQRQGAGSEESEVEVVQTSIGSIHRLLRRNGQLLGPAEVKKEDSRILQVVAHPAPVRRHEREEQKDGKETADLLKMLPNALNYQYSGTKDGVVTLKFTPKPSFKPRHREGEVFHHMSGTLLVDASQKRIVEFSGRLTSEVKFGGGILGHLDQGGTFLVNQKDVGGGHWEITRLFIHMNGKALFFKTIDVHHDEQDSDFQPVPGDLSLQQAAELLHSRGPDLRAEQQGSR